ncbi:hypothetical protein D2T31_10805 [Sinirhodobacter populi]|uniref:Phage tail protein n=1 Tax=Paenirhodobacter populi TaxID=2306993 RepID=A0A443K9X6_9RHOB|nr:hypothetical protein [Sinirhodobacter populi]RWR29463.1 hypothetical protein D2T31_10805 [Sinirhodobacter populi]
MLYATAGAQFFIADRYGYEDVPPVSEWVEIAETEALGALGGTWDMEDAKFLDGDCDLETIDFAKIAFRPSVTQVVLGIDPEDAGQLLLWKALRDAEPYPFRLLFPDKVTSRSWFALVTGMSEVFDTANNVMKLQADLQPVSKIRRSEDEANPWRS